MVATGSDTIRGEVDHTVERVGTLRPVDVAVVKGRAVGGGDGEQRP